MSKRGGGVGVQEEDVNERSVRTSPFKEKVQEVFLSRIEWLLSRSDC